MLILVLLAATPESIATLESGCTKKIPAACTQLGRLYESGEGVKQDLAKARKLYETACSLNEATGCNNLSTLLAQSAKRADRARVIPLLEKGCELGAGVACGNLGGRYLLGADVAVDLPAAARVYKTACDNGIGIACNNLGNFLVQGRGVKKDVAAGKALLKKTCDAGVEQACVSLASVE